MLRVERLEAAYGASQVLFGVDLDVGEGEVVTLLGRNGMGKTTTVRAIMGIVPPRAGQVHFDGRPIHGLPPHRIAQFGLGLVPEGRQVFPNLTVRENLVATAANRRRVSGAWTLDRVLRPVSPARRPRSATWAHQLSGGEQQMLAIGASADDQPAAPGPRRGDRGAGAAGAGRDLALSPSSSSAPACRSSSSTRTSTP